jgi:hypothetical protein
MYPIALTPSLCCRRFTKLACKWPVGSRVPERLGPHHLSSQRNWVHTTFQEPASPWSNTNLIESRLFAEITRKRRYGELHRDHWHRTCSYPHLRTIDRVWAAIGFFRYQALARDTLECLAADERPERRTSSARLKTSSRNRPGSARSVCASPRCRAPSELRNPSLSYRISLLATRISHFATCHPHFATSQPLSPLRNRISPLHNRISPLHNLILPCKLYTSRCHK